jgi:hypothetical protein
MLVGWVVGVPVQVCVQLGAHSCMASNQHVLLWRVRGLKATAKCSPAQPMPKPASWNSSQEARDGGNLVSKRSMAFQVPGQP